ncbi:MAG: hypothetical protein R3313_02085 [Candidatus Saccharimonadales bacterium]|nr:hypothetical protein [Candidatus Saccharimonadales bacterium]
MTNTDPSGPKPPVELTTEAVERAHRGESDNPIMPLVIANRDLMFDYHPETPEANLNFARQLMEASPYQLDVETIIATYARGPESPAHHGVATSFGRTFFGVHILYDPDRPKTAEVALSYVETGYVSGLNSEEAELSRQRYNDITKELRRIKKYIYSGYDHSDPVTRASQLAASKNPEDIEELNLIIQLESERKTPLLNTIPDNFRNSMMSLLLDLEDLIDA